MLPLDHCDLTHITTKSATLAQNKMKTAKVAEGKIHLQQAAHDNNK